MKINKMVCLGDSITWGFPFGPQYSWVDLASRTLDFPMINRGINGDTADDLLERFSKDVALKVPSHVFIMVGTNDASIGVSADAFLKTIHQLHSCTLLHRVTPIFGQPVPSFDRWLEARLEKYRRGLSDFTAGKAIGLVDFSPAMLLPDGSVNRNCFTDEVHPSKTGYRMMAGLFVDFCRKYLFDS